MVGVYKITSPSGKIYIGQSWDIHKRWVQYKYKNLGSRQFPLTNSIMKYGYDAHQFEVIHELPLDVEQIVLDRYEQLYMDLYRDAGFVLMNCKEAGSNGKPSQESIQRQIKAQTGGKRSEETKAKMSAWQVGKIHSEETKNKIGSANRGRIHTQEHRDKVGRKGKKKPFGHGENVSKALTGVPKSKDHKTKLSESRIASGVAKGSNNPKAKLSEVDVKEIRDRYAAGKTLTQLYKEYGMSKSGMYSVISGKNWPT